MKAINLRVSIATIALSLALLPSHVRGLQLVTEWPIEEAVEYFSNIVVVRVISGNVLKVSGFTEPCEILYKGEVDREIKGHIGTSEVLFLSGTGFTVGDKYLLFLSDKGYLDEWGPEGRLFHSDDGGARYPNDDEVTWMGACADLVEAQDSKVFLSWVGTSLGYTTLYHRPDESWFTIIGFRTISIWSIANVLDIQYDKFVLARNDREDGELTLQSLVVSESSIIDWLLRATKSNGRSDVP